MYFLYLDDSGSTKNADEDYFVLGGVAVPEKSIRWLSYELEKIAQDIYPQAPEQVEFHASEIFGGKRLPWNTITKKRDRISIIQKVLCIIDKAHQDIVLFAYAIHKMSYPKEDPVMLAYEDLAGRFDMYLSESGEKGLVILDKSSYETGLQNLALSIRKTGNRWGNQTRSILEVPLFVDSTASRITQFADHIAYAVFRRYNANDLSYFNCIESRFYSKDNIVHGLVHKQTITKSCTCPACITRR